ncbi:DUF2312 domain-containing protein [Sphingomonas paeninsulae]|uniref:DUF2312 domain-containing protein n=1 Tax=Sphingomonas paeninsulae TaxID=2319844 RepID=A0A494T8S6_SPHPE|nr:GapR family DNA-binding domain-containing protein [Sphingomonas paeninsulae]AYJ85749.1 DUF2312 domain-containing protein [Sphingomonas paeninsulae]
MSIGNNRATALFHHIRALENLQEVKDEAASDFNERKKLCKEDGFDTNVVTAILKRRKNGEGQTLAFDDLLREYEEAIEEERRFPGFTVRVVDPEPPREEQYDVEPDREQAPPPSEESIFDGPGDGDLRAEQRGES